MFQFFGNSFFNFEAIRIVGMAGSGGAEIAECLDAVGCIRENDPTSWHRAWSEQAEWAKQVAREAQRDGNRTAARMAFLRASNYTRASAYMMTGVQLGNSDSRVISLLRESSALFASALELFDTPVKALRIPYPYSHRDGDKEVFLPAYLHLPLPACRLPGKIPLLISQGGADSIQEEQYYMFPSAGPGLGYAVLTFDGPGQGSVLHEHDIPMRADWEVVIDRVLAYLADYSRTHPGLELDLDRIAIAGASLGGYFALRAAADQRIKACVAIDPMYDFYEFGAKRVAPTFFRLWDGGWIPDCVVNSIVTLGTRLSFQSRWEIFTSARFLGATTPVGLLRRMQGYTFHAGHSNTTIDSRTGYLDRVKCPVLVTGAAQSLYFDVADHTAAVIRGIREAEKECWTAERPGQGGLQAKMGAVALCNQRVFAFLDRVYHIERSL
ncbi:dipeptidyl aminopeptidase/acylaminoacyl peptidase [Xylariaceae sp. FL0594]|nr:dipeptidyl aminopeptidase/acylaminoacyl peptidase [Xylariaceae sp. FL0594]